MGDDISDDKIEKALKYEIDYYQNSYEEAIENVSQSLKVDIERVAKIAEKFKKI